MTSRTLKKKSNQWTILIEMRTQLSRITYQNLDLTQTNGDMWKKSGPVSRMHPKWYVGLRRFLPDVANRISFWQSTSLTRSYLWRVRSSRTIVLFLSLSISFDLMTKSLPKRIIVWNLGRWKPYFFGCHSHKAKRRSRTGKVLLRLAGRFWEAWLPLL